MRTVRNLLCLFFLLGTTSINALANDSAYIRDPFIPAAALSSQKPIPLQEAWIPLYFIQAAAVTHFLSDRANGFLSSDGHIQADTQTNQLWIKDSPSYIQHIKTIIQHLDQQSSQFLIKAQIIMIDRRYHESLGIQFNTVNEARHDDGYTPVTENAASDTNTFAFVIAKLAQRRLLNLQLSALEQAGHATVISKPVLITLNHQTASIESGAEVPYQEETATGATSVSFKKAVLSLKVTPQQLPYQHILLHIALTEDKVSDLTINGVPAIETQQMHTQVITLNKQMVILGGIFENSQAQQRQGVPVLGHLPIIGGLFRHHQRKNEQQMLLICITTEKITE